MSDAFFSWLAVAFVSGLVACDGPGTTTEDPDTRIDGQSDATSLDIAPDLPTSPTPVLRVVVDGEQVVEGFSVVRSESNSGARRSIARIDLSNVGGGTLRVRDVVMTATPAGSLYLEAMSSGALPSPLSPVDLAFGDAPIGLSVMFVPQQGEVPVQAAIVVAIEDPQTLATDTFSFQIQLSPATPSALASSERVDFGTVPAGQTATKLVTVTNVGGARLELDGFRFSGHLGYSVEIRGQRWSIGADTAQGLVLPEPLIVAPQQAETLTFSFATTGPEAAQASFVLVTNDPAKPEGLTIELDANAGGPCIVVSPRNVTFPATAVGTTRQIDVVITSCGSDLTISDIALVAGTSPAFSLALAGIGPFPRTLATDATLSVPVTFAPTNDTPPSGTLRITSDAFIRELDVELSAQGSN